MRASSNSHTLVRSISSVRPATSVMRRKASSSGSCVMRSSARSCSNPACWRRMRRSVTTVAATSCIVPTRRIGWPPASRSTRPRALNQRATPLTSTIRNSKSVSLPFAATPPIVASTRTRSAGSRRPRKVWLAPSKAPGGYPSSSSRCGESASSPVARCHSQSPMPPATSAACTRRCGRSAEDVGRKGRAGSLRHRICVIGRSGVSSGVSLGASSDSNHRRWARTATAGRF